MRMIVTSWLSEVASEYGLHEETLFLAVSLLDRFLSCSQVCGAGSWRALLAVTAVGRARLSAGRRT